MRSQIIKVDFDIFVVKMRENFPDMPVEADFDIFVVDTTIGQIVTTKSFDIPVGTINPIVLTTKTFCCGIVESRSASIEPLVLLDNENAALDDEPGESKQHPALFALTE
jgi:hypothetical protein